MGAYQQASSRNPLVMIRSPYGLRRTVQVRAAALLSVCSMMMKLVIRYDWRMPRGLGALGDESRPQIEA